MTPTQNHQSQKDLAEAQITLADAQLDVAQKQHDLTVARLQDQITAINTRLEEIA